ncbi:YfmQ family protein [Ectobacillus ponti]|uniref:YfmQ family protein n=1 Tax=Ectobacillus ponti TaxID=2961894 RepID=A0AA41XAK8_9BACI|nr:YfmQ family protein [Ectobacillus ponti]MCP8969308.1 YfmQ family protein [Ectobacillus ponti]
MTWTVLVPMILFGIFKIVVSSLPSGAVDWIQKKVETHQKLDANLVEIQVNGESLGHEEKMRVIEAFNEAAFLEQYAVFPGYEQAYLDPERGGTPFVLHVQRGRKRIRMFLYCYTDRVDVVKQHKKKITAYKLRSNYLQQRRAAAAAT